MKKRAGNSNTKNVVLLAALLLLCQISRANTITWTNTLGGNWSNPLNWSPNEVPGQLNGLDSVDDVLITNAGTYTVVLDEGTAPNFWDIRNLTLGGGSGTQTLAMTNKILYAALTITNGGVLADNTSDFHAAITVANGGRLDSTNGNYFVKPFIIAGGGAFTSGGNVVFEGGASLEMAGTLSVNSGSLTLDMPVTNSGAMNVSSGAGLSLNRTLTLFGPLTNSGTVTINSNSSGMISISNNLSTTRGGIVNLSGGVINLSNSTFITGGNNHEYFINQGTINSAGGNIEAVPGFTNSGAINAGDSTLYLDSGLHLQSSGSLNAQLDSASIYGKFSISGNVALAGALNVTLAGGFNPQNGNSFQLVTYSSFSGSFSSTNLPAIVPWQMTYGSSALTLSVTTRTITWTNTLGGDWSDPNNWSPNIVPGVYDDVGITTPGTYTVVMDQNNASIHSLTLGASGGVQTLGITNKQFYADSITINSGGALDDSDSTYRSSIGANGGYAAITVNSGGQINSTSSSYYVNPLTIANGGQMTANGYYIIGNVTFHGPVIVENGGVLTIPPGNVEVASDGTLTVADGGEINSLNGRLFLYGPMTNSGAVTVTETTSTTDIEIYNNGTAGNQGFLLNLPGGTILLNGPQPDSINTGTGPDDKFVNQGTVISSGSTGTRYIRVSDFDNSAGVVTNLLGTLNVSTFTNTLAGTFYATNGATIQFQGGAVSNPLKPGNPLALLGGGNFQFTSGWLDLTNDIIPDLQMTGGYLELGPAFQGGVITNLALDGITLTNAPGVVWAVTNGTFAVTNSAVYGDITVENGGQLIAAGVSEVPTFHGNVTVSAGGLLAVPTGYMEIANDGSLTVDANATADISGSYLFLYGPMTNSGTVMLTGGPSTASQIFIYNNGTASYQGSLLNLAGTINLGGTQPSLITTGTGPDDYFINEGVVVSLTGSTRAISVSDFDNTLGVVTNLSGTLSLGAFTNTLAGTFYTTNGTTIQFKGGAPSNPLKPGNLALLGGGNFQFASGWLDLPSDIIPNLQMTGGYLELGPAFQGGAITNVALDGIILTNAPGAVWTVTNGTFAVTNSVVYGDVNVENDGQLIAAYNNSIPTFQGNVTVEAGGIMTLPSVWAEIANGGSLMVDADGTMNILGGAYLQLYGPLTNSGTINLLGNNGGASEILIYSGTSYNYLGDIWNLTGGTINLDGVANGYSAIQSGSGSPAFINQGAVVVSPGSSQCSINAGIFDNSAGVVTNFAGTLPLSSFTNTLAGTFYAASGSTIQFKGGAPSDPLKPGNPLALLGGGHFQFTSGWLDLPSDIIPNLQMTGGYLELEPTFQGGAITNLALDGITLTNLALSVGHGIFALTNSSIYGNCIVQNGGQLIAADNGSTPTFHGNVTVEAGGIMTLPSVWAEIANGGSLTVDADGTMNILGGAYLQLYGPLTNSGTINLLGNNGGGSEIFIYNGTSYNYQGGIWNLAGGTFSLDGVANGYSVIQSGSGSPVFINQGAVVASPGSSACSVNVPGFTNSGAITALTGTLNLNTVSLQPSGSLNVRLNSKTDYGKFSISGTAALAGAFNASLNGDYIPGAGDSFTPLTYGSFTGNFTATNLSPLVAWQTTYNPTTLTLRVTQTGLIPEFTTFAYSGGNLIFNGTNGAAGATYWVLASTNLNMPVAEWTPVATNTFGSDGHFSFTNTPDTSKPQQFFIVLLPK